jgi:hypothetical protein
VNGVSGAPPVMGRASNGAMDSGEALGPVGLV